MAKGSALAVHKETVTPAQALAAIQEIAKTKYDEAIVEARRASKALEEQAGGQTERLDSSVVQQGRTWAHRLAIIARRSAGASYNPSKSSIAIQAVVKKIFSAIGELEAIVANDIEIPLFNPSDKKDMEQFFGYEHTDIRKVKVADLIVDLEDEDPEYRSERVVDELNSHIGDAIEDDVAEYLRTHEIVVEIAEASEGAAAPSGRKKAKRRRAGRNPENFSNVDGAIYHDEDGDD